MLLSFKQFLNLKMNESIPIDDLLDKINISGIESLTDYEKSILDRTATDTYKYKNIEQEVFDYLDTNYGDLVKEEFSHKGIGNITTTGYLFVDPKVDMAWLRLEVKVGERYSNTLYIDSKIWNKLSRYFGLDNDRSQTIFKKWLSEKYDLNMNMVKLEIMFSDNNW